MGRIPQSEIRINESSFRNRRHRPRWNTLRQTVDRDASRSRTASVNEGHPVQVPSTTVPFAMTRPALIEVSPEGLWCPSGGFHIDPWVSVERAVITHAHADHARPGSTRYLSAAPGLGVMRRRLPKGRHDGIRYGERLTLGDVVVSLHPAGHVLGSAQVRIERRGEVCVIGGDHKLARDPTCTPFEAVPCHHFVSESTFGLPVYRWPDPEAEFARLRRWRRRCREESRNAILGTYALGKAQRVLATLDEDDAPILVHGALRPMIDAYREAGVAMPEILPATKEQARLHRGRALVLAPPSALAGPWIRTFLPASTAAASGWMRIRGVRRRRNVEIGFVVSDHADWPDLLETIDATGCERVSLTHGFTVPLRDHLRRRGRNADILVTRFGDEEDDESPSAEMVSGTASTAAGERAATSERPEPSTLFEIRPEQDPTT